MSCKMNSNRAYIHGYCSPCKWFFSSFFLSPLSNCNRLARGRSQRHYQTTTNPTTKPSTTTKHRNLAQKNISKSVETQKSTQPKINRNPKYTQSLQLSTAPTTQTHRKPIGKTHMKNPTKTHMKNPSENPLDLPWFATDLPPICSSRLLPIYRRQVAADLPPWGCCWLLPIWVWDLSEEESLGRTRK